MRGLFKGADYAELEKWYDGYRVGKLQIYNPKSVADALTWNEIQSYWTGTETYEALKVYIDLNFDGLKEAVLTMLGNGRCVIDPSTFQNDMTVFRTPVPWDPGPRWVHPGRGAGAVKERLGDSTPLFPSAGLGLDLLTGSFGQSHKLQ